MHDKHQIIEEPCEVKVSRTVLKTNGVGDNLVEFNRQLSPAARLELAKQLSITGKSKPTRRVWIPKPGTKEKRPLGIPTMYDRALQAVIKAALEPEWEAYFEPNRSPTMTKGKHVE